MDAVRESYAFTSIPARGFTEFTRASVSKLREIFHEISVEEEPN